jgi:hypothetical protein
MKILYWKYDDGRQYMLPIDLSKPKDIIDKDNIGWYCWVFTDSNEHQYFLDWLQLHIRKGYDAHYRFNGGDPMTTLRIIDNDEALKFKEYWGEHFGSF